jgi:hypothetical protein
MNEDRISQMEEWLSKAKALRCAIEEANRFFDRTQTKVVSAKYTYWHDGQMWSADVDLDEQAVAAVRSIIESQLARQQKQYEAL